MWRLVILNLTMAIEFPELSVRLRDDYNMEKIVTHASQVRF